MNFEREVSSFRDPSGFLFWHEDDIYRAVSDCYAKDYEFFISSGLYDHLKVESLVVAHKEEVQITLQNVFKVIKPQKLPFISYPYEWSARMLKDAALLIGFLSDVDGNSRVA